MSVKISAMNCNFPIYFSVFGLIFYGLGTGLYNLYAVLRSRKDPEIGSQMWVMPFILVNAVLAVGTLIVACIISKLAIIVDDSLRLSNTYHTINEDVLFCDEFESKALDHFDVLCYGIGETKCFKTTITKQEIKLSKITNTKQVTPRYKTANKRQQANIQQKQSKGHSAKRQYERNKTLKYNKHKTRAKQKTTRSATLQDTKQMITRFKTTKKAVLKNENHTLPAAEIVGLEQIIYVEQTRFNLEFTFKLELIRVSVLEMTTSLYKTGKENIKKSIQNVICES
ncbi:hypothetical protein MAR_002100 [Mya arenaria]|uniref:Transmembrane protein n=1 Tax=Mya arenaria TaxID=6604 RepID=A0ABY7FGV6_MYAAR|nr:hypothetical protein MAR_002100 [Mya arenaria]